MISPNLTRMAAETELQKICTFVKVLHAVARCKTIVSHESPAIKLFMLSAQDASRP